MANRAKWFRGFPAVALLFWLVPGLNAHPVPNAAQNPKAQHTSSPAGSVAEARSLMAQGNAARAVEVLSAFLQSHPKDVQAQIVLGEAYALSGQTSQAETVIQKLVKESPGNIEVIQSASQIYAHEGQLEKAEALLAPVASVKGSTPALRMQWAVVLARLHRFEQAAQAVSGVAVPAKPEEAVAYHRLKASIASGRGDLRSAAAEMERALTLQPENAGLVLATAVAEVEAENWDRAAKLAEPIFQRTHDPQSGLVVLEAQVGRHAEFRNTQQQLHDLVLKPADELGLRQRMAQILISHGEFSASIEEFSRAAELDPSNADIAYNLALAQFKAGRLDDALMNAQRCKALTDRAEVEDLIGDIQEARGDNLAAVRSFQEAVALAPNEVKYRLSLAMEFVKHSNFDAARVVLQQARETWPNSWQIQLASGLVEHLAGSDENASRILLSAARLAPDPEIALKYLGDIQIDQAAPPSAEVIAQVCAYADQHPKAGDLQYDCGGLLFRRDYLTNDKTHADAILRRLSNAAGVLPDDARPHCQLGRTYRWLERWPDAKQESEACVRLDPSSADGHYRLAQIYQHLGETERSEQEMKLHAAATQRMAEENARRDESMKTFLYTIQKQAPGSN